MADKKNHVISEYFIAREQRFRLLSSVTMASTLLDWR